MIKYTLNEAYPNPYKLDISKLEEYTFLDFTKTGGELHILLKSPIYKETEDIQYGNIQVSFMMF